MHDDVVGLLRSKALGTRRRYAQAIRTVSSQRLETAVSAASASYGQLPIATSVVALPYGQQAHGQGTFVMACAAAAPTVGCATPLDSYTAQLYVAGYGTHSATVGYLASAGVRSSSFVPAVTAVGATSWGASPEDLSGRMITGCIPTTTCRNGDLMNNIFAFARIRQVSTLNLTEFRPRQEPLHSIGDFPIT